MNSLGICIFVLFAAGQLDSIHANKTNANMVLNFINSKRRLHGCPPVILSDDLSLNCTKRAEDKAKLDNVTHSKPSDNAYTENTCTFGIEADSLRLCVEKWYNGSQYDMMDAQAEEFTAMIWRSSKFMGYGEAMLNSTEAVMVVRFVPGGNVLDHTYNVPSVMEHNEMDWTRKKGESGSGKGKGKTGKGKQTGKKPWKRWRWRKRRRNCAIHQAYLAPRVILIFLTISYWLGYF